jgi:hypothetical protein
MWGKLAMFSPHNTLSIYVIKYLCAYLVGFAIHDEFYKLLQCTSNVEEHIKSLLVNSAT